MLMLVLVYCAHAHACFRAYLIAQLVSALLPSVATAASESCNGSIVVMLMLSLESARELMLMHLLRLMLTLILVLKLMPL